jgi:3-deoxy-manno-octulosonate cytidylyltransferase (CMP-KDO synthetase)
MLTSKNAKSGTDRIAEVAKKMSADVIVNIQGDEPLISPKTIDRLIEHLQKDKRLLMATVASPIRSEMDAKSADAVKVVVDQNQNALYFSRSPIPYHQTKRGFQGVYRHCGLYAYRKDFLLRFTKWKQTPLEIAESLEQLRALEKGVRIRVLIVPERSFGVDTKKDLEKIKKLI